MNCAKCGRGTAQIKVYIVNTLAYSVMNNANSTDITEFLITESLAVKTLYVTFCKPSMK
jgi:phosphopantetheine adenylyltransferase